MSRTRSILCVAAALVAVFVATTWWALESDGVAIVETRAADGSVRATRVWYTETDGELWLEAGTPVNSWFQDVQRDPALVFRTDGRESHYLARPVADPEAQRRVRSRMREKYGLRDRWVGLLFDTSRSVAVRLVPAEA